MVGSNDFRLLLQEENPTVHIWVTCRADLEGRVCWKIGPRIGNLDDFMYRLLRSPRLAVRSKPLTSEHPNLALIPSRALT